MRFSVVAVIILVLGLSMAGCFMDRRDHKDRPDHPDHQDHQVQRERAQA